MMNLFPTLIVIFACGVVARRDPRIVAVQTDQGSDINNVISLENQPDVLYLVHPVPLGSQRVQCDGNQSSANTAILATHISVSQLPITGHALQNQFDQFQSRNDDVWIPELFLDALFITYVGPKNILSPLDKSAKTWLVSRGVSCVYTSGLGEDSSPESSVKQLGWSNITLPLGPLGILATTGTISVHSLSRLYRDDSEAFMFGAIPGVDGSWVQTNISLPSDPDHLQYIPVPSRLAYASSSSTLSGLRFGLKDIFHVQGLPTAAGSLAYARLYPTPHVTASSVERLLSLGAVLVGKTRTSQFAHGSNPWEYVDFPYSWNPRADGYLTAAASSSGSACAIASYDWLDFSVGSDTRGSVRKPASLVGVYGIRPSFGEISVDGVVPLAEAMDTIGFFARDPWIFHLVSRLWFKHIASSINRFRHPRKLLYPIDHFPARSVQAQAIYESFLHNLSRELNLALTPINLTQQLLPFLPLANFTEFQVSSNTLVEYYSWTAVGRPLTNLYREHFGVDPAFDPVPNQMFARGKSLTKAQYDNAVAYRHIFAAVVSQSIFPPDPESCSESILVYDAGTGGAPSYRIEDFNWIAGSTQVVLTRPDKDAKPADALHYLASMAGLPDITVPIGQSPYFSQLNRTWEMLPVTIQLVARQGCDATLLDIVASLASRGILISTRTGRNAF